MPTQHEFELDIRVHIPSYNRMKGMTLREMMRLRKEVHTAMYDAFRSLGVEPTPDHRQRGRKWQLTWRLPEDCLFTAHVTCEAHVYRRSGEDRCDPHNFVTPVDKLLIDLLQCPRGNRWRGFGLIADDGPKYFTLAPIVLHQAAPESHVRLVFRAGSVPVGLRSHRGKKPKKGRAQAYRKAADQRRKQAGAAVVDDGATRGHNQKAEPER